LISPALVYADNSSLVVSQTINITTIGQSSWTVPAGVSTIKVQLWGAGGGGGNGQKTDNYNFDGLGGGGGGYSEKILNVNPGDTYSINVGGGGGNPPSSQCGQPALNGGTTSFNGWNAAFSAYGGTGGMSCWNNNGSQGVGGGADGGDTNLVGGDGGGMPSYNPFGSDGGNGANGGIGGAGGRCGRDGNCQGSDPSSPFAQDGSFPGGGGVVLVFGVEVWAQTVKLLLKFSERQLPSL